MSTTNGTCPALKFNTGERVQLLADVGVTGVVIGVRGECVLWTDTDGYEHKSAPAEIVARS